MCLTWAIISAPGKVWLEKKRARRWNYRSIYVILWRRSWKLCVLVSSVNIFHLNKRLGQATTLLSNSTEQAADQKHNTLKTFIGVSFWHVGGKCFTCYECHLQSVSTGGLCRQQQRLAGRNTHQRGALYLHMIYFIWLSLLQLAEHQSALCWQCLSLQVASLAVH